MVFTGKQKAAMLLMSLDTATASKLLKDVNPDTVRELAVELAYLDAAGYSSNEQSLEYAKEFYGSLQKKEGFQVKNFLKEMLYSTVGKEKAEQIQEQIQDLLQRRDPFIPIRSAGSQTMAAILKGQHPQAIAVALSELSARKSSDILKFLEDELRQNVIARMASGERITSEAKMRIAEMLCGHLEAAASDKGDGPQLHPEQSLRKVAVILRNLGMELRDGLLEAIKTKDNEAAEKVINLMIIWEDITEVTDRSLQEVLRGIDAKNLALALVKSNEAINKKIRSNISERAAQTLDEEASLMSSPTSEEIDTAREQIVQALRDKNESGELAFIEEE